MCGKTSIAIALRRTASRPMCPVCVHFVSTFRQHVTTWLRARYKILCPCVHFFQLVRTHRNEGENTPYHDYPQPRAVRPKAPKTPSYIYISISIYRDIFIYNWTHGHISHLPYSLLSAYQILSYVSKPQNPLDTKCTQTGHMGTNLRARSPVGGPKGGRHGIEEGRESTNAHHDGHSGDGIQRSRP